jgi:hypothetical protein
VEPFSSNPRSCMNCGAVLQPEHRFCPNCGMAVPPLQESVSSDAEDETSADHVYAHPSTEDTQRHRQTSTYPPPTAEAHSPSTPHDPGHPTWGTPGTTVQPESGNRTLWIIIGIIAFIVIVCCCVLPLGLAAIANIDTAFQDQLRSAAILTHA